jgi:hypothetical protein
MNGGGVYVNDGTFTKSASGDAVIYGSDASPDSLKNTAINKGHAVYVADDDKQRNTTAGADVALDSTKNGTAGGW